MEIGKLYNIGKIAAMMGISVQTLRYYEKIGLFSPSYVNPETGYRYYEYTQMQKIDRIRYLQKLGIPLESISEIYDKNTVEDVVRVLKQHRDRKNEELLRLQEQIKDIDWYIDYWTFMDDKRHFGMMYLKHFPKRYALMTPMGDVPFSISNEWFYTLKNRPEYQQLECLRQYVSILDDTKLRKGKNYTSYYGQYLKKEPDLEDRHIFEFPEGDYMCFLARIYDESEWTPEIFEKFLDRDKKYLVLADEYEDNLYEFARCMYEVQIIEQV